MSEAGRSNPTPELSTALVPLGERSLAHVSDMDVMQAELEAGSMELVSELAIMAANIREHSREEKIQMLEQVVGLLKKLEIEASINGHTERVTVIQRLLSFIPKIREQIRKTEQSNRRADRIAEARRQLIAGAKQISNELGIDISSSIPELQEQEQVEQERIDELELYLSRLETYLADPAIKHGVLVKYWVGEKKLRHWDLGGGYIAEQAIKEKSLILRSEDKDSVTAQIEQMFGQVGKKEVVFQLDSYKITLPDDETTAIGFWMLHDIRRIMQETKDEYERELARLKKDN